MSTETQDKAEQVQQKASQVMDQAQSQAKEMASQAQQQAKSMLSTRKDQTTEQLDHLAQAFRQTGEQLRDQDGETVAAYTERMASQIDRLANYLDDKSIDEILDDTENFARRQPELFLGAAFAVGLLAARFLKSSSQRRQAARDYGHWQDAEGTGYYTGAQSYYATSPTSGAADWGTHRTQERSRITEEW
jgi:hypothetical protein